MLPLPLRPCSAKVIPGNEPRVSSMLNSLAMTGARIIQSRDLHTSGARAAPVGPLQASCFITAELHVRAMNHIAKAIMPKLKADERRRT